MKSLLTVLIPVSIAALTTSLATPVLAQQPAHISNLKQLTHGGQNAEAYWSPDGSKLIFQSTRDGNQCDQIYIMNADGSDQRMVSTGQGVTTCGYFLPDGEHFVYASTHEAGPSCPAPADRSKGYVWAVYPGFDIYLANASTGEVEKKLTDAARYDAEATVNFEEEKIVYTSMATGDLELWSMGLDGSNKTQLTRGEGYDGGAVYSRDGSMMVWRAHRPRTDAEKKAAADLLAEDLTTPMKMELFVAAGDGSNARQITEFGCASFAPTFTPDGSKILFSSNRHACDTREFELYMMNPDGSGLEQVTSFGGFTSFPEFSPDGTKLAFESDYQSTGNYEFNVFTADWK